MKSRIFHTATKVSKMDFLKMLEWSLIAVHRCKKVVKWAGI